MKKLNLNNIIWKEGKYYVAQCLNVDVSSFGKTKEEALKNIKEALDLYFDEEKYFVFISQKGRDIKYRKYGFVVLTDIVPADKKEIPYVKLRSIVRQAK